MSSFFKISNGDSIELCTELPEIDEPVETSLFCWKGSKWNFRFVQHYSSSSNDIYYAYIQLKEAPLGNFRSFQFDFQVKLLCEGNLSLGKGNKKVTSSTNLVEFWTYYQSDLKSKLPPTYRTGNIIKFSFCFHLPSEPAVKFQFKNQDKSVQTGSYLNTDISAESLTSDYSRLLDSDLNRDTEIKCGENSIKAHKLILCARSEVFKAMLQCDMMEGRNGIVEIQDINIDDVRDFIRYLYTGILPELTLDKAKVLYEAGDKYAVKSLMIRCSEYLQDNVSSESACQILALAVSHSDQELKDTVINYILEKKVYLQDELWLPFCESYPKVANEIYILSYKKNVENRYQ